jgi:hypothetical protein
MLNDTTDWLKWKDSPPAKTWLPIGSEDKQFKGTFDGKGHKGTFDGGGNTVLGAYVNSESDFQGLFGYVSSGGTIKNLVVYASYIKGIKRVGGLVGGLLGEEISFSYFNGIVTGIEYVGGFVGHNEGKIIGSYSDGLVVGSDFVGGFVGENEDNSIIGHCFSTSAVFGLKAAIGGFAGENSGTINYSYSVGDVTGGAQVGGLAGRNNKGTIANSYSFSVVTGKSTVGGLVGYNHRNSKITSSYSIGEVTGSSSGGLVGMNGGTIDHSYYDNQTSKQSDKGKGEGKTTAQKKQKATFVGWDFKKVWDIKSEANDGYPYLLGLW